MFGCSLLRKTEPTLVTEHQLDYGDHHTPQNARFQIGFVNRLLANRHPRTLPNRPAAASRHPRKAPNRSAAHYRHSGNVQNRSAACYRPTPEGRAPPVAAYRPIPKGRAPPAAHYRSILKGPGPPAADCPNLLDGKSGQNPTHRQRDGDFHPSPTPSACLDQRQNKREIELEAPIPKSNTPPH